MIVVDTNVWSEQSRPDPAPRVTEWLAAHGRELRMASVVAGEMLAGVAVMPEGRRKEALRVSVDRLVARSARGMLSYDEATAREFAAIVGMRRRAGRPVHHPTDAMIAAIARVHGASVATRNVDDFADMGVELINPWEWEPPVTSPV